MLGTQFVRIEEGWLGLKKKRVMNIMRNFSLPVLSLPRSVKILVVFSVDANLCVLTVWLAYYLRLGQFVKLVDTAFLAVVAAIVIAQPIFIFFGLYRYFSLSRLASSIECSSCNWCICAVL